jgi:hypothetical protein
MNPATNFTSDNYCAQNISFDIRDFIRDFETIIATTQDNIQRAIQTSCEHLIELISQIDFQPEIKPYVFVGGKPGKKLLHPRNLKKSKDKVEPHPTQLHTKRRPGSGRDGGRFTSQPLFHGPGGRSKDQCNYKMIIWGRLGDHYSNLNYVAIPTFSYTERGGALSPTQPRTQFDGGGTYIYFTTSHSSQAITLALFFLVHLHFLSNHSPTTTTFLTTKVTSSNSLVSTSPTYDAI